MVKKRISYKLEKFFPTKCPKCFKAFKKPNKDFNYYADPRYSPSKAKEIIDKFPELYNFIEKEGIFTGNSRFDSGFIICENCKNITFRIVYASLMTHSKEKAIELIKDGSFNSITKTITYGKTEKSLEEYTHRTEGTSYLSKIAINEIKDLMNEIKTIKAGKENITDVEEKIKRLRKIDPLLDHLLETIPDKIKNNIKEDLISEVGPFWEKLHNDSKKFLTTGEIIFNALKKYKVTSKSQNSTKTSSILLTFSCLIL